MQANATSRWEHRRAPTCCEAPGTCGELVQGAIDGRDFLVNCPIDLFSRATVFASARAGLHLADPQAFSKIADVASLVSRRTGLRLRHELRIDSEIPRGKGMASSTADITAALDALCRNCAVRLSDTTVARLLAAVEPSDCVHFPGIAHVNHLTGQLIESLPAPADLTGWPRSFSSTSAASSPCIAKASRRWRSTGTTCCGGCAASRA